MPNTIRHKRGTTTPAAGSLVTGELAINTATGSVFTKTDAGTVVNIAASGSASWGSISGTLSSQTDLSNALALKADLAGATFTGKINTPATTAASAFLNLPHGTVPSAPVNGDLFTTTFDLGCRINGSTRYFAQKGSANTFSAGQKQTVSHSATTAGLNIGPVAGDPSGLANGDVWLNSTTNALNARVNGQTMPLNAVKAWVNFTGTGTGTWAGGTSTVTRAAASTTATVTTTTAHGLVVGNVVWALTGVTAGAYTVTAVGSATTFSFTTVESTALTAASITFAVSTIRASFNVSSITDNGVGDYTVNFTTALADTNYALVSSTYGRTGMCVGLHTPAGAWTGAPTLKSTTAARIATSYYDANLYDTNEVHVAFIR